MKTYKKDDIEVVWKSEKCIHAAFCARELGSVFKPKDRPWIQTEHATKEEIVAQVARCPSGALSTRNAK